MVWCVAAVLKEACKQGAAVLRDPTGASAVTATAAAIRALEAKPYCDVARLLPIPVSSPIVMFGRAEMGFDGGV